jgi:hypothetical protein
VIRGGDVGFSVSMSDDESGAASQLTSNHRNESHRLFRSTVATLGGQTRGNWVASLNLTDDDPKTLGGPDTIQIRILGDVSPIFKSPVNGPLQPVDGGRGVGFAGVGARHVVGDIRIPRTKAVAQLKGGDGIVQSIRGQRFQTAIESLVDIRTRGTLTQD